MDLLSRLPPAELRLAASGCREVLRSVRAPLQGALRPRRLGRFLRRTSLFSGHSGLHHTAQRRRGGREVLSVTASPRPRLCPMFRLPRRSSRTLVRWRRWPQSGRRRGDWRCRRSHRLEPPLPAPRPAPRRWGALGRSPQNHPYPRIALAANVRARTRVGPPATSQRQPALLKMAFASTRLIMTKVLLHFGRVRFRRQLTCERLGWLSGAVLQRARTSPLALDLQAQSLGLLVVASCKLLRVVPCDFRATLTLMRP